MNDFQMTHLSADRISDIRAEADRQRLARSAGKTPARARSLRPRGSRRLSLSLFLGRATA